MTARSDLSTEDWKSIIRKMRDIWENSIIIKEIRSRYVFPLSDVPGCANCEWVRYCNGGCPGIVQQIQKTVMAPSMRMCYRDFLIANGIESVYDA